MYKKIMSITHGNLFSGIGGMELAAEWCGWNNVFQVEIDKYCQKVLAKNFPNTKRYGDIKEFDGTKYRGTIDVLSGSPPCQSASIAGKRKGKADDRWLWPEALRVCGEIKPSFVIFENPPGILSLENGKPFKEILLALEAQGYSIEIFNIPAAGIEAWHIRERIWILAYSGCWVTWQSSNTKKIAPERYSTENSSGKTCRSSNNGTKRIIPNSNNTRERTSKSKIDTYKQTNQQDGNEPRSKFSGYSKDVADTDSTQRGSNKRKSDTETNGGHNIGGICKDVSDTNKKGLQTQWKSSGIQKEKKKTCSSIKRGNLLGRKWNRETRQSKSNVGRVANGLSRGIYKTINNYGNKMDGKKKSAKGNAKPSGKELREVQINREPSKTSPRLQQGRRVHDFMQEMSCHSGSGSGISEKEKKEAMQDMWKNVSTKPQQETQYLQQGMPFGNWEKECNETLGYWDKEPENVPRVATGVKNRVNRLKGLGNAVVPQIPYIFFQIISQILNNEN